MRSAISVLVSVAISLAFFAIVDPALAGSATWSANPTSSNWVTDANWTPTTVPSFPGDIATFQTSSQTSVSLANAIEIGGIVFAQGANPYTITTGVQYTFVISGAGITNNSGVLQTFVINGGMSFTNAATAGNLIMFQNHGGITFTGAANAGSATFNVLHAGMTFRDSTSAASANITALDYSAAGVIFRDLSTAADAQITVSGYQGGSVEFEDSSTAGNSTLTAANGASISFLGHSTAGTATLSASSATILFNENSTGEMSRVILNDANGALNFSAHAAAGGSVGSIEGYGVVLLGSTTLTVGTNNASTTYSGQIQSPFSGTLVKTGTGTLTLTNSNTYRAGTRIDHGTLRASHDLAFGGIPVSAGLPNYVSVAPGAALTLDSGATNNYIVDVASLIIATGSTVNLNFTGNSDRVRSFILDGVTQPPGTYGGPFSRASTQLPQFNGNGTIVAVAKAVSRKVHGDAGAFDIDLPFAGGPGIECRDGNGDYQVVVTFVNNVTFSYVAIGVGTGYVSSYSGSGTNTVIANLTGVSNAQVIYVSIHDLNDGFGSTEAIIPMGILVGDVNGNGTVNVSDVVAVKSQLGPVTVSNFRADVNPNGIVNASDIVKVKTLLGTSLP